MAKSLHFRYRFRSKLILHSTPLAFGEGLGVRLFVLWRGVGGEALRPLESSRG